MSRKIALAKGETKYFTGKPCGRGHISERWTCNGKCVDCHEEDKIIKSDKFAKYKKRHYEDNKEKIKRRVKHWRGQNKDRVAETNRQWRKKHAETHRELVRKRRTQKAFATPVWADRNAIEFYYALARHLSRLTGIQYHVDHIIPLQNERVCGLHVAGNLQVIQQSKNSKKSNTFQASETGN